jgi:hypothetical protein
MAIGHPANEQTEVRPIRLLFTAALFVGGASIAAGWMLERPGLGYVPAVLTVIGPLLAMAGYVGGARLLDRAILSRQEFGDSVYYLGFLFTLIALTVSLFGVAPDELDTQGLVYRFGVALTTTIVGLAARIWLTHFLPMRSAELARLEDDAVRSVQVAQARFDQLSRSMTVQGEAFEAAVAKTVKDLDQAGKTIQTAAKRFSGAAADGGEALSAGVQRSAQMFTTATNSAAKQAVEELRRSGTVVSDAISGVAKAASDSATRMTTAFQSASDGIAASTDTLRQQVQASPLPSDLFADAIKAPLESLQDALEQATTSAQTLMTRAADLGSQGDSIVSSLEGLAKAAAEVASAATQQMREVRDASSHATAGASQLSDRIEQLVRQYSAHAEVMDGEVRRIRETLRVIQNEMKVAEAARRDLEVESEEARRSVKRIRDELVAAAQFIRQELKQEV